MVSRISWILYLVSVSQHVRTYSPSQDVIEARFQLDVVFVDVIVEVFSSEDFGYSHQLHGDEKHGNVVNRVQILE